MAIEARGAFVCCSVASTLAVGREMAEIGLQEPQVSHVGLVLMLAALGVVTTPVPGWWARSKCGLALVSQSMCLRSMRQER